MIIPAECGRRSKVSECTFKAIIYKDLEDVYGPCGCGMDMAMWPVLLPRAWMVEEKPRDADDDGFCIGFDYRRVAGMSCTRVFEHEMDGVDYLANYSCCKECAEKAVKAGYAVWSEKQYPMVLR